MGDEKSEPTVGVVKQIDSDLSSVQLKIVSLKTLGERADPRRGGLMSYRMKDDAKTDKDRGDRRRISTAALLRKDQEGSRSSRSIQLSLRKAKAGGRGRSQGSNPPVHTGLGNDA